MSDKAKVLRLQTENLALNEKISELEGKLDALEAADQESFRNAVHYKSLYEEKMHEISELARRSNEQGRTIARVTNEKNVCLAKISNLKAIINEFIEDEEERPLRMVSSGPLKFEDNAAGCYIEAGDCDKYAEYLKGVLTSSYHPQAHRVLAELYRMLICFGDLKVEGDLIAQYRKIMVINDDR